MNKVLIAGGSGFIGRKLSNLLLNRGYDVAILSRGKKPDVSGIRFFYWDIEKGIIENGALDNAVAVINLAGANIAAKRWNTSWKAAISDSRVHATELLVRHIQNALIPPPIYISSSATGYYGAVTSSQVFTEQDKAGTDFLAQVCTRWEQASKPLGDLGIRRVLLRTGVVLSREAGLVQKVLPLAKMGFSPIPGNGNQWLPWVHIEDIAAMYVFALEHNQISGIYNACADAENQPDYAMFIQILGRQLHRPLLKPHIPGPLLKGMLGEMAEVILNGSRVSAKKLQEAGYSIQLPTIREALSAGLR
jgi:uncharacterized protein (TIGR01777 family)